MSEDNPNPMHKSDYGILSKVDTDILIHPKHTDWACDIKISNDNTKGEKRVTVHVRSDGDPVEARKKAHELYVEELGE